MTAIHDTTTNANVYGKKSAIPRLRQLLNDQIRIDSTISAFWSQAPVLMAVVQNGKIQEHNPAWNTVLEYSDNDLFEKCIMDIVHPDDITTVNEAVDSLRNGAKCQTFIARCKHSKKGHWLSLKWSVSYEPETDTLFCTSWPD